MLAKYHENPRKTGHDLPVQRQPHLPRIASLIHIALVWFLKIRESLPLRDVLDSNDLNDLAGCGRKVRRSAAAYGASTVSAAFGM